MSRARIKVTIVGYYDPELESYDGEDPSLDEMVAQDTQLLTDGTCSAGDVLDWLEADPVVTLTAVAEAPDSATTSTLTPPASPDSSLPESLVP